MKGKFLSVKWEIMAVMLALVMSVIGGLSFFTVALQEKSLIAQVEKRGAATARAVAGNIADMLLIKYDLDAAKVLNETVSNGAASYALVADNDGKILAHNDMTKVNSVFAPGREIFKTPGGYPVYAGDKNLKVMDFTAEAMAKGRIKIGTVHAGIPYSIIDDELKKAYLNILSVTAAAIMLSLLAAFFLSAAITKPIQALVDGVKIAGTGDLNHKIAAKRNNELGILAGEFNVMTEGLKKAREKELGRIAFEKELEIAAKIQSALLPVSFPGMAGYEVEAFYKPAKEVGGDFYDVIALGENRFGIVMADVSGKGIPAALVMTMLSGILNIEARAKSDPKDVICALNDELLTRVTGGMFATVLYGILDTGKNTFEMVSAGHHETFIYDDSKGSVISLCPRGAAVGLFDGAVLKDRLEKITRTINPGDKIMLFTDGISDAQAVSGARFGIEKAAALLKSNGAKSGKGVAEAIRLELQDFTYSMEQSDDIAMLIIDRKK